jgi:hypothetical protein
MSYVRSPRALEFAAFYVVEVARVYHGWAR